MSPETTKTKLLEGALRVLTDQGIAKTSARTIAAEAGVNQALVFYHFGSVDELLAGAQTHTTLGPATAAGLQLWIDEIEKVLTRVLAQTPFGEFADPRGLARAVAASFVGIELYEGVDETGAHAALDALQQLGSLIAALEDLGPVAQRAVRLHLRRRT